MYSWAGNYNTIVSFSTLFIHVNMVERFLAHLECPEEVRNTPYATTMLLGRHFYKLWQLENLSHVSLDTLCRIGKDLSANLDKPSVLRASELVVPEAQYPCTGVITAVISKYGSLRCGVNFNLYSKQPRSAVRYCNNPSVIQPSETNSLPVDKLLSVRRSVYVQDVLLPLHQDKDFFLMTKAAWFNLQLLGLGSSTLKEMEPVHGHDELCLVYCKNRYYRNSQDDYQEKKADVLRYLHEICPNQFVLYLCEDTGTRDVMQLGQLQGYDLHWFAAITQIGQSHTIPQVPKLALSMMTALERWNAVF